MIKDTFSPSRCASLSRLYITENKRFILLSLASVLGILVFMACFSSLKTDYVRERSYDVNDRALISLIPMYIVSGYILGALGCSVMFSTLKKKQGRINLLMVPANASEKLISRAVLYMIVFPVVFIILVCVAESLRCLMVSCTEHVIEPMPLYIAFFKPGIREHILPDTHACGLISLIAIGSIAVESLFVLGSAIWPKASALKTFVVFSALTIFYITTALWFADSLSDNRVIHVERSWLEKHCIEIFICLELIAIIFNLGMTWLRLREFDVITTRR